MNEQLYQAIISHANTNYKTIGRNLFNAIEVVDATMAEIPAINYASIESLQKRKENIMTIYAKRNNLM